MPNTDLTTENLREEILTELGFSGVDVELVAADLDQCVKQALRLYSRYCPFRKHAALVASSATKQYRLDNLPNHENLLGVVSVDFLTRRVDPAGVDPFDPYVTSLVGPNYGDETFADILQRKMYAEDAARIISSESEWYGQWEDVGGEMQYKLYLTIHRDTIEVSYAYTCGFANTDVGRRQIPLSDVDWFVRYCVAHGKTILGRIRGKFGGVTNPEGGVDQLDHQELQQEGREDKTTLEEELRQRRVPMGPVLE